MCLRLRMQSQAWARYNLVNEAVPRLNEIVDLPLKHFPTVPKKLGPNWLYPKR